MKSKVIFFTFIVILSILLQSCVADQTPSPTAVTDLVAQADKLLSEGKPEEAFALYNKDIQNNQDLARAYAGRGNIYSAWKKFDEAISDYTKALSFVRTPEVLSGRCNAYRLISQFPLAESDCKEALQIKPDYSEGYIATALLQLEQNKNQDALKTIQEGAAKNPNDGKIYYVMSKIDSALGNLPATLEALGKAILLQPKEAQFYCDRGFIYYSTAQLDKSRADYKKASELGIPGKDDLCLYKSEGMLKMLGK